MQSHFLEWNPELSVDNESLDKQHRELFRIINTILDSEGIEVQSEEFAEILTRLTNYVLKHFKDEEAYMHQIGYPKLKEHALEHKDYSRKVAMYNVGTMDRDPSLPANLSSFLQDWWLDHVKVSDQEYRRYAGNSGNSGT
ncbi:MAG: hypothetical protein A2X22_05765 [Bacteroidetes bacterium GWF2_49_14]|nr:MAG: hypothetical protein A2X22_05765 [Bacteroidetes bacterium GWF2_49_14]HBB90305.1 hypothetical protein [Bacteroidales bacterium]